MLDTALWVSGDGGVNEHGREVVVIIHDMFHVQGTK
jgi:hypothetical protein